jgi:hypothetical protein
MMDRERVGREASPSAADIDRSQSVKTTESGGPKGYDAGKKVAVRKRQAMVDTDGRALVIDPQQATSIQDRTAPFPFSRCRANHTRSSKRRSPIAPIPATSCRTPRRSTSKSSGSRLIRSAWRFTASVSRRAVLRLDQLEPPALERRGGNDRLRDRLPLRRLRHDPHSPPRPGIMTFPDGL